MLKAKIVTLKRRQFQVKLMMRSEQRQTTKSSQAAELSTLPLSCCHCWVVSDGDNKEVLNPVGPCVFSLLHSTSVACKGSSRSCAQDGTRLQLSSWTWNIQLAWLGGDGGGANHISMVMSGTILQTGMIEDRDDHEDHSLMLPLKAYPAARCLRLVPSGDMRCVWGWCWCWCHQSTYTWPSEEVTRAIVDNRATQR
jgi:hypothetical protein